MSNSTFAGNSAGGVSFANGGGIYNDYGGTLTVSNSTFAGNSAVGVYYGNGGGIYNDIQHADREQQHLLRQ